VRSRLVVNSSIRRVFSLLALLVVIHIGATECRSHFIRHGLAVAGPRAVGVLPAVALALAGVLFLIGLMVRLARALGHGGDARRRQAEDLRARRAVRRLAEDVPLHDLRPTESLDDPPLDLGGD
jgi:hypothetical protein